MMIPRIRPRRSGAGLGISLRTMWTFRWRLGNLDIHLLVGDSRKFPQPQMLTSSLTTFAEIQLTFDGYPTGNAAESTYFVRSLWTEYNMVVLYYDTPYFSAFDVGSAGAFESKVLYTGEDPDNVPVTLKIYGGPFIDSDGSSGGVARMFCRYNGNSSSDIAATYVSPAEVHCPVCVVSDASGTSRCGYHGTEGAAQYILFAWLNEGIPKSDVDVALTMNGIDYHSSATQTDPLVLHVYGKPNGVSATHPRSRPCISWQRSA